MKLNWARRRGYLSCEIIDLIIVVGRGWQVKTWEFDVTHIYGSGGALMHDESGFATAVEAQAAAERWFEAEGRQALMDRFLGWFDNPHETEPAYDPEWGYCPFCTDSLGLRVTHREPLITVSLLMDGDDKSYFYRAHKRCHGKDKVRAIEMEAAFVDLIVRAAAESHDGEGA